MFTPEFTKTVKRLKRDDASTILKDPNGVLITDGEIGVFTFRVPTGQDTFAIDVQAMALLSPISNPSLINPGLVYNAVVHATIPRQVLKAPEGWDWAKVYGEKTYWDIYEAYAAGLEDIKKQNPQVGL